MTDIGVLRSMLRCYDLRDLLDKQRDDERVAFLTYDMRTVEVRNLHPEPTHHFELRRGQLKMIPKGDYLFAVLHTHPYRSNPYPSEHDLESITPGMFGVVLHVASGTRTLYQHRKVILTTSSPREQLRGRTSR